MNKSSSVDLVITGGVIKSLEENAIKNTGNTSFTIGISGDHVSTTEPIIQGEEFAVDSINPFYFYDGILKGATAAYNTTPTVESGYGIFAGTETIQIFIAGCAEPKPVSGHLPL